MAYLATHAWGLIMAAVVGLSVGWFCMILSNKRN